MQQIRKWLSFLLVGSWAFSILAILIVSLFGLLPIEKGLDAIKVFSSVTSGFVGIVLGYYFTRSDDH
jgi:hypothetical protein